MVAVVEKDAKQSKVENNLMKADTVELKEAGDIVDKKINTDIIPRIGHLDNVVSDLGKDVCPVLNLIPRLYKI